MSTTQIDSHGNGVVTDHGVITGLLEVTTEPGGDATIVTAGYVGAVRGYVVEGSPLPAGVQHADVVAHLAAPRPKDPDGNPTPATLTDFA